jgi:plasmid stability protein
VAILQIKGIDDALYARLRQMAAADHRSISQEVLHLIEQYLTRPEGQSVTPTSARALLALSGSWDDERGADEISATVRAARRNAGAKPAL